MAPLCTVAAPNTLNTLHTDMSTATAVSSHRRLNGMFSPVGSHLAHADAADNHNGSSVNGGAAHFGRMSRRKDCGGVSLDRPTTLIATDHGSAASGSASAVYSHTSSPRSTPTNEDLGLCVKCGMQLYQIKTKKKGLFQSKVKEVRVPLSIPGQVERGQCLQCGTSTSCSSPSVQASTDDAPRDRAAVVPSSPSSSSHSDTDDVGVKPAPHHGSSIVPPQSQAVYEGPFNVYGERDGTGKMTWDNGDVYTGEFFNGNRHGHGTLCFADGSEYVGEWECNVQHGVGTRRWANGDCYTGQYLNGKRTGEGRFYFTNGDMYIGMWIDGIMQGPGRYYYASGQRFEGVFRQGKRHGKGKLQRTDGSLDLGVYQMDVRIGLGVRWSADRTHAWQMRDGLVRKKIAIPEAVALDYDMDAAAQALDTVEHRVV